MSTTTPMENLKEVIAELQDFDKQSEEHLLCFVDRLRDLLEALKKQIFHWKDACLEQGEHFRLAFHGMEALTDAAREDAVQMMHSHEKNYLLLMDLFKADPAFLTGKLENFFEQINKEFVKLSTYLEESDVRSSEFLREYREQINSMVMYMEEYANAACKLASSTSESVMYAIQEVQFQDLITQSIDHVIDSIQDFRDYVEEGGLEGSTFSVNLLRLGFGILEDVERVLQDANVVFIQQIFIVERFFMRIDGHHKKLDSDMSQEKKEGIISEQTQQLLNEMAPLDRSYLQYLASKTKILNSYYKLFMQIRERGITSPALVQLQGFILKISDQITSEYTLYQDARQSVSEGMVDIFMLSENLLRILTEGDKEFTATFEPKVKVVHDDATILEHYCQWISKLKSKIYKALMILQEKQQILRNSGIKDDWDEKQAEFQRICDKFTIVSHKKIGAEIAGFTIDEGIMTGDIVMF